jgi:hypothetical protein
MKEARFPVETLPRIGHRHRIAAWRIDAYLAGLGDQASPKDVA